MNDNQISLEQDIVCQRVLTIVLNNTEWVDMELVGQGLYEVINRPNQAVIDRVLNRFAHESPAMRMGNNMLFTDETRTIIKITHGVTIRKQ